MPLHLGRAGILQLERCVYAGRKLNNRGVTGSIELITGRLHFAVPIFYMRESLWAETEQTVLSL